MSRLFVELESLGKLRFVHFERDERSLLFVIVLNQFV
jgi:hypothetical protein